MSTRRKFRILSIDDDPEVAVLLKQAAQSGFPEASITSFVSVDTMTNYLQEPNVLLPHLILLDLNMPDGETGFTLLNQLRNNASVHLIPIIILSASDSNSHINEAYFQGANAYMTKPESYPEWIRFMELLKNFWQQTATLPRM